VTTGAAAGLHVLATLAGDDDAVNVVAASVVAAAAEQDVALEPLGPHDHLATHPPGLILGYSRLSEPALIEAAKRLRAALAG
jgi:DNA-binding transcriptional MocR family regulator